MGIPLPSKCELLALLLKLAYETNLLFSKERENEVRVAENKIRK